MKIFAVILAAALTGCVGAATVVPMVFPMPKITPTQTAPVQVPASDRIPQ